MLAMSRLCVAAALLAPVAAAAADLPLEARARDVCAHMKEGATGFDQLFAPALLAKAPQAPLEQITATLVTQLGACTAARVVKRPAPARAEVELTFAKGYLAPAKLSIAENEPHLIEGLWIGPPVPEKARGLGEIAAELKALPGTTALLVRPLDGDKPLAALNEEQPLAVGSSFKLYVLAELAREIEAGARKSSDVVTLRQAWKSLPSGQLQTWPDGSPVTLHTLALMMISISDNTATDHLIRTLGAEAIERNLVAAGDRHPERLRPFLTTGDAFRLKLLADDATRARWARAPEKEKRQILAGLDQPLSAAKIESFTKPIAVDSIEWYASAGDLCRVMERLRAARPLREVLTVNHGLALDESKWSFIGFKGGSEPGVLNATYLLERKDGKAFCVSASWNDPKQPLDELKFFGLVQAVLADLEKR